MTITHADKISIIHIDVDSQWDTHSMDKFIDWEPHSNGQLFITHVDPNPKTYPDESAEPNSFTSLDSLSLDFGKYRGKTPTFLLKHDPDYIVWCRTNTERVFCSDELYDAAKRICSGKKGLMR